LWQHQVCALFNGRRNEGDSEYICPECCCIEMERGERKPLPSSAVLGAKDLPKTLLSDHLEQRLTRKLKEERAERAKAQGKSLHEVLACAFLYYVILSGSALWNRLIYSNAYADSHILHCRLYRIWESMLSFNTPFLHASMLTSCMIYFELGSWCRGFGGESGSIRGQKGGNQAAVFRNFSGRRLSN